MVYIYGQNMYVDSTTSWQRIWYFNITYNMPSKDNLNRKVAHFGILQTI